MSQQIVQGVDDLMPSRVKEEEKKGEAVSKDAKTPKKLKNRSCYWSIKKKT